MPLSGIIPITRGQSIIPPGSWYTEGVDGNVYTVSGTQGIDGTSQIKVGSASLNATIWDKEESGWLADLATLNINAGGGVITQNAVYWPIASGPITVRGTNGFYLPGNGLDAGGDTWNIFIHYKIMNGSTVSLNGAEVYCTGHTSPIATVPAEAGWWDFGDNVIDGNVFAVIGLAAGGTRLIRLPVPDGNVNIHSNPADWNARYTNLGTVFGDTLGVPTYFITDDYFNRCTILKLPTANTIRIMTYRSTASLPGGGSALVTPGSEYVDVNWSTQVVGALTSAQSELGQPWPDDGLGYSGTPTANNWLNRYGGPTVGDGAGASAREVIFSRQFDDNITACSGRRFRWDETTGLFSSVDTFNFNILNGSVNDRGALCARGSGSQVFAAKYGISQWELGEFTLPPISLSGVSRRFVGKLGPVRV